MSEAPTPLRHWLPVLLSGRPHQIIGGDEHPYLRRWYVIPRNPLLNVYVHQFLRSDDDRALHDHPWWFVSLMLRGKYDEITESGMKRRRAGSIAYRPAEWRHRVHLLSTLVETGRDDRRPHGPLIRGWRTTETPCWTLIVTGRRRRMWGFWCKTKLESLSGLVGHTVTSTTADRFIPWEEFGDAGCGEPS